VNGLDFCLWRCKGLIVGGLIGGLIVDDEKWVESSKYVGLGKGKIGF
jgi:hypothetical protein